MTLAGHTGPIRTIQAGSYVAPTVCSGSDDGTVRIWDVRRASAGAEGDDACRVVCVGHNAPPTGPPLVPPRPASHAALKGSAPVQANNHHAGVRSLQWHWGKVASTGYSRKVLVHDFHNGALLFSGTGHTEPCLQVFMDASHIVSASLDSSMRAWFAPCGR